MSFFILNNNNEQRVEEIKHIIEKIIYEYINVSEKNCYKFDDLFNYIVCVNYDKNGKDVLNKLNSIYSGFYLTKKESIYNSKCEFLYNLIFKDEFNLTEGNINEELIDLRDLFIKEFDICEGSYSYGYHEFFNIIKTKDKNLFNKIKCCINKFDNEDDKLFIKKVVNEYTSIKIKEIMNIYENDENLIEMCKFYQCKRNRKPSMEELNNKIILIGDLLNDMNHIINGVFGSSYYNY